MAPPAIEVSARTALRHFVVEILWDRFGSKMRTAKKVAIWMASAIRPQMTKSTSDTEWTMALHSAGRTQPVSHLTRLPPRTYLGG